MPGFDGTGPRGAGPMTGRGEGHCVMELPEPGRPVSGYAGLAGVPVRLEAPAARPAQGSPAVVWPGPVFRCGLGRAFGRGRGWGRGRG